MNGFRVFALRARESFWFLPAIFGAAAIILAEALVFVDQRLIDHGDTRIFFLDSLSASGGRSILSIIGSSVLTVAGTSFSITISVLATTSSTYGPRLVRNFLADRMNQLVLATFTSTFLYALLVLRSVRTQTDDGGGFVPVIAIHVAVVLGVVNVAVLVFFIHHIADSVQITTIQRRVQTDLVAAVDLVFPAEGQHTTNTSGQISEADTRVRITADSDGYVEQVDLDRLVDVARRNGCVLDIRAMPGTHVIPGETLVAASGAAEKFDQDVRGCFALGPSRTPHQDVRFALQQLVEVAVRGLASGTNDPYTAVTALDLSAVALVPMLTRPDAPTVLRDLDGKARVLVYWPAKHDLVVDVLSAVEIYGLDHPLVVSAALRLITRLQPSATGQTERDLTTARRRLEGVRP